MTERNEIHHMDYLFLFHATSKQPATSILVQKDDLSQYVQLMKAKTADRSIQQGRLQNGTLDMELSRILFQIRGRIS